MATHYTADATASATKSYPIVPPAETSDAELAWLLDGHHRQMWACARRIADVRYDADATACRLLAADEARLWAHARDLQDPTWWLRPARPYDHSEDE